MPFCLGGNMKKSIKMLLTLVLSISFVPIGANAYQVEQDPIDFGGYFPG